MPPWAGQTGRDAYRRAARRRPGTYRSGAASSRARTIAAARGKYRKIGYYRSPSQQRGELKFWDTTPSDVVTVVTGEVINSLNLVPQNITETGRIGRKIRIKKIHCRYNVILQPFTTANNPTGDILRVIFFQDTQCNGVAANTTDILDSAAYLSHNLLVNRGRFRILKDTFHVMNQPTIMTNAADTFYSPESLKHGNFSFTGDVPIEFSGTTGAITEVRSNNFGILLISRNALVGFAGYCRVRYTDA